MSQRIKIRVGDINDGTYPDLNKNWGNTSKKINADTMIEFECINVTGTPDQMSKLFAYMLESVGRSLPLAKRTVKGRLEEIKRMIGVHTSEPLFYNYFKTDEPIMVEVN